MNASSSRELIVQGFIIVAVCIGGWMMFVQPKLEEVRKHEATIAEATGNPLLADREAVERMANRLSSVRDRIGEIERQNSFTSDSSQMYGLIKKCSERHGVSVKRLDPGSSRGQAEQTGPIRVTAFNMTVSGTYQRVAAFLESVNGLEGFLRPVLLRLSPTQGEERLVEAQFSCEAVSIALPDSLTAMAGGTDAVE